MNYTVYTLYEFPFKENTVTSCFVIIPHNLSFELHVPNPISDLHTDIHDQNTPSRYS